MKIREALWGEVDPYEGVKKPKEPLPYEGFQTRCPVLAGEIDKRKPKRILEIGTHRGASACWMAECAPQAEVLTVDTWNLVRFCFQTPERLRRYATAKDYFRSCVLSRGLERRVTYLPMPSDDAFALLQERAPFIRFDLAYIDGGHSERQCKKDIQNALVITDGPIIVDDYEPGRFEGVVQAVMAVCASKGLIFSKRNRKAVLK